jgi:rhodanese-related sulfurtransferase
MAFNIKLKTINQKLAALTLFLGFIAIFIGNPQSNIAKVNIQEISQKIDESKSKVSPEILADWIIKNKADFMLIDLRDEKQFNEYHINNSENIQIQNLIKSNLPKTQKIILYSDNDGFISAQAWFLLNSKNFRNVYVLDGGLDKWKKNILFPSLAADANSEAKSKFEKSKEVSKFFGGTPLGIDSNSTGKMTAGLPKLSAPVGSGGSAPKGGKPKKEGC